MSIKKHALPKRLRNIDFIDWDISYTGEHQEARTHWNDDDGCLEIGMKGNNVNLQVGQEILIRAKNDESTQINNGEVVYISGGTGSQPLVKLANNTDDAIACKSLAIATEDVGASQFGYFTTIGLVRDVDTDSWTAGDELYLDSTSGQITNVKPSAPNKTVVVGYVIRKSSTEGVIFVSVRQKSWLRGYDLTAEPTGFPNRTDSELSFVDGTRTFSIAPTSSSFDIYVKGQKYNFTNAQTVTITDTEGLWFFYFDSDGVLTASQTPWSFGGGLVFTAIGYWDSTNNSLIGLGDERHGLTMDNATHAYLHFNFGSQYYSGHTPSVTADGNGSLDAHAELQSVSAGIIYDEDIELSAVEQTSYEMWYKTGGTPDWRKTSSSAALVNVTATRPNYNLFSGGSWSVVETDNTKYTLTHLFITNDINSPNILIMGENQYNSKADAQDGALVEINSLTTGSLPTAEFVAAATFIIQCSDAYTNSYNARVVTTSDGNDFVDFRTSEKTGVGAVATDHGNLAGLTDDDHTQYYGSGLREPDHGVLGGLGDDDHTQYHNDTRGDARYLQKTNNLSDVSSASTSFNNIKQAATSSATGVVELATAAEINTGTDTTRAIPIDQFVASNRNIRFLAFNLVSPSSDVATGTNIGGDFVIPFSGTILQSDTTKQWLMATNSTAGTTGTMVVDINKNGSTIMTTNKLDIETGEKTTETATTQPDLTTTSISAGDIITIDVDAIHTTPAKGLTVYMAVRES